MSHSRHIEISLDEQKLHLFQGGSVLKSYPISSSSRGMGNEAGSYRTPTGNFKITEKIGEGAEIFTQFEGRKPIGIWKQSLQDKDDFILSRILVLDGTEPENQNTKDRYIYIHGTHRENLLGTPASHGCIRMANTDIIELFDEVPEEISCMIHPLSKSTAKLLFIDCDSTLSEIEGIDELARLSNPIVFDEVVKLTNDAMNGTVALDEVFSKRMEIIRPHKHTADVVSELYIQHMLPGVISFLEDVKKLGWIPIILSGGFEPLIRPLAKYIGIDFVEAVPLYFDQEGNYIDYGRSYPTTRNLGKNEIIQQWKKALLPTHTMMIGDGISDLETKADVDLMIGFGGVVSREKVKLGADIYIQHFDELKHISFIHSPIS